MGMVVGGVNSWWNNRFEDVARPSEIRLKIHSNYIGEVPESRY